MKKENDDKEIEDEVKTLRHYIDNTKFCHAMTEWKKIVKEAEECGDDRPPVTSYIAESFLKIAEHLSHRPNFINYPFREDMIGDGVENCLLYAHNFDPDKSSNPFSDFTQIIYYAFLRRIAKEKKQLYVKYKATEQFGILDENEMFEDENGNLQQFELYDNISEFIQTYEETKKAKKKKKVKGLDNFIEKDIQNLDEI